MVWNEWMASTGLPLPLPPGEPAGWTNLLRLLGPRICLMQTPSGIDVLNSEVLRGTLAVMGRPVSEDEQLALLLTTPIPDGDLAPVLFTLLGDVSFWVRHGAALLLGGSSHPRAVMALQRQLDDPDNDVRRACAVGLGWQGSLEGLGALVQHPWDEDPAVNGARLEAVAAIAAKHGWAQVVQHESLVAVGAGGDVLRAAIQASTGSVGGLLASLRDGNEALRHGAGMLLAACPSAAARGAEAIAAVLQDQPGVESQRGAIRALGAAGEDGAELAAELLSSEDWQHRCAGAMALTCVGSVAARFDAALLVALDDVDADVQREATLARLVAGVDPSTMIRRLLRTAVRHHQFLERANGVSLGPLDALMHGTDPSLELLGPALRCPDDRISEVALLWLGDQQAELVGATLGRMALDEGRRWPLALRRASAGGLLATARVPEQGGVVHRLLLAGLGSTAEPLRGRAGELVQVLVHDSDADIRLLAVQTLHALGDEVKPFLSVLRWHLRNDPDDRVLSEVARFFARPWTSHGVNERVASVLEPSAMDAVSGGPALMALAREHADLAIQLATGLLDSDARHMALAAATVVGHAATQTDAADWCSFAIGRLSHERWLQRESAATLLGAISPDLLSEGLREEAAEALGAAARDDHDADVQAAAYKAASHMGAR